MEVTTINMCLLIEIRHNILIQCHGNHIEVEKPQLHTSKVQFKKLLKKTILGVLRGNFCGFGCPNESPSCPTG